MSACVYMGGQYRSALSPYKKLSTDLSGFHHPSLIQGCSKSETRRKSGKLAGTWKGFKRPLRVGASPWGWAGQCSLQRGKHLSMAWGISVGVLSSC